MLMVLANINANAIKTKLILKQEKNANSDSLANISAD